MSKGPHAVPVLVCDGCRYWQAMTLLSGGRHCLCQHPEQPNCVLMDCEKDEYCRTPRWCPFLKESD